MSFQIAGKNRLVIVTRKKMKNLVLRVDKFGNLKVNCPYHITDKQIQDFLCEKENWILKTEQIQMERSNKIQTGKNGKTVTWLGKEYPVNFKESTHFFISFTDDNKVILGVKELSELGIEEAFYQVAAKEVYKLVMEKRDALDEMICRENDLPFPKITIKYMTSRWGSCSPSKNHISISMKLIHYPIECLEYVLLHEYAHLLVPNHSKSFYDVIKQYMPEYKKYSDYLKE